ncbi:malonyl-ACP O-methyltransferase BioC [Rhodocyclus tenuis]|uniref:Malonyl-[acyl-carrier protein] O-methyltransferase n=1 Tax=Rhodocyclus tenuis TaxID=1066 RepID=A0A840G7M7_RHOTE|nr:malonyl-ACP O-methyltransferase BioC [Rhodocyclus tenuis]MBB4247411.1 malonyl-CoA O-methyltransferase [Rhodocyclus tenuis]
MPSVPPPVLPPASPQSARVGAAAIDRQRVRQNFARVAASYDGIDVAQREIARRMFERLDPVRIEPRRILDLGCGNGACLSALHERYPRAELIGADISPPMLAAGRRAQTRHSWLLPFLRRARAPLIAADACALPLPAASVGFVWSNLMLHWLEDPRPVFAEAHRVLENGGLLMFATFGPDTLKELRSAFAALPGDTQPHTHRFIDMHDLGDMLVAGGFADPVMDMEMLTLTYPSLDELLRDLRGGGGCALRGRRRGLLGRAQGERFAAAYQQQASAGRLPASLEVIYGHAWRAEPKRSADGSAIVRMPLSRKTG